MKTIRALTSPQHQFALYMPMQPKPLDPFVHAHQMPRYERRHHYFWAIENRRIVANQYSLTSEDAPAETGGAEDSNNSPNEPALFESLKSDYEGKIKIVLQTFL